MAALKSDLGKAENKFKLLKEDQKSSFRRLLSIFEKQRGKIKIDEIKDHFNFIINVLSRYINIPIFFYSDIPSIDNICEIKNVLVERIHSLFKENRKEDNSVINKRFTIVVNCTLHQNGYTTKVAEVIGRLTEKHQLSPSSNIEEASLHNGTCAQVKK